jgi:hypothetical protein
MRAAAIVEGQIPADPGPGLGYAGVGAQVDLFVFDGSPQALDEDIVPPESASLKVEYWYLVKALFA